jgi:hypothetical protein
MFLQAYANGDAASIGSDGNSSPNKLSGLFKRHFENESIKL